MEVGGEGGIYDNGWMDDGRTNGGDRDQKKSIFSILVCPFYFLFFLYPI